SSFSYKNLYDLNNPEKSCNSPLSIICHIDINAYYAQYEQLRLGLTSEDPVVCLQWQSLVAVSYAARKYGIGRMDTLQSAKEKCPNLIVAHTAVFKKGEEVWKYVDYLPTADEHKVCLDPYRRESRKMMRVFKTFCDSVEKASVDECFMDFGRLVFKKLTEYFPFLLENDSIDKNSPLPMFSDTLPDACKDLKWMGHIIPKSSSDIETADSPTEDDNEEFGPIVNDWDDMITLIGSQLGWELRELLKKEMGYTTSLGIARVKTIAKLASGFKKPNNQTIVCNDSINKFLSGFRLTDFWSMGGKIGDAISKELELPNEENFDEIGYIRDNFTLSELKTRLDDAQLADRLYHLVRGDLHARLEPRVDVKSMGSSKNFKQGVKSKQELLQWFKVFLVDLMQRIYELDEENEGSAYRRPTRLSMTYGTFRKTLTRQLTLMVVRNLDELKKKSLELSEKLLDELIVSWDTDSLGPMFPCIYGGLGFGSFKETEKNSRIDLLMNKVEKKSGNTEQNVESSTPISPDSEAFHNNDTYTCSKCGEMIALEHKAEHDDYHYALTISEQLNNES
ncbi:hypothetical protein CANARDRAFT_187766, partial [[Candida] arabinofermentans NRRL YB-2248]